MLIPVILSGGSGSRLWPASRALHPKPFLKLPDGETLLHKTLTRASNVIQGDAESTPIIVVTNHAFLFETKDAYAAAQLKNPLHLLLEPQGRNTAPAIAMAAHYVKQHFGGQAQMLVLAADHLIEPFDSFLEVVQIAQKVASLNKLVTFGIEPRRPETGYGYIEADPHQPIEFDNQVCAYTVSRFVEKPTLSKAELYIQQGNYYWNSGMFCFQAEQLLKDLTQTDPSLSTQVLNCWTKTDLKFDHQDAIQAEWLFDKDAFSACEDISIDYSVMERASDVAVIPSPFLWNDIGAWDAMADLSSADANGNRTNAALTLMDEQTKNTFIQSDRLVATVGVEDLLIIDTSDALLIANRKQVQHVKKVVEQLKKMGHSAYQLHDTVHRPWGLYTVLEESPFYKIKRIEVKPQASLSLQSHQYRSEHWIIVAGQATVTNGVDVFTLNESESTFIAAGQKHRLQNLTEENLIIIEVQTGSYLGEDDIQRFEDVYGRSH